MNKRTLEDLQDLVGRLESERNQVVAEKDAVEVVSTTTFSSAVPQRQQKALPPARKQRTKRKKSGTSIAGLDQRDADLVLVLRERDDWMNLKQILAAYQNSGWDIKGRDLPDKLQELGRKGFVIRAGGKYRAVSKLTRPDRGRAKPRTGATDAILEIMGDRRERSTKQVHVELQERGIAASPSSTSSILCQLKKKGLIDKPRPRFWQKRRGA